MNLSKFLLNGISSSIILLCHLEFKKTFFILYINHIILAIMNFLFKKFGMKYIISVTYVIEIETHRSQRLS